MQLSIKDKSYLWDICEACKDIIQFTSNINFSEFNSNKMIRYAVERQILVVGEAANHLSDAFRMENSSIPWSKIIGMRNIIAHEYGEILVERIWLTAKNNIPNLLNSIEQLIVAEN